MAQCVFLLRWLQEILLWHNCVQSRVCLIDGLFMNYNMICNQYSLEAISRRSYIGVLGPQFSLNFLFLLVAFVPPNRNRVC